MMRNVQKVVYKTLV
jgi:hypothetical protein